MNELTTPITYDHPRTAVATDREVPEHFERMVDYMREYRNHHGYVPSNREMVEAGFGSSTSVVRYYYDRMAELNMIQIDKGIARGIRILPRSQWKKREVKA